MKMLKPTPAEQSHDEANQIDITNAPWLSEGDARIADYIENKVVQKELGILNSNKPDFTPKEAERLGRKHGVDEGTHHAFPQDCHNAYREVIQRIRDTLSAIVKREKDKIYKDIKEDLPNMEHQLEQKLNRNEVEHLTSAAEKSNKADRKADKFLLDRGLDLESPEATEGEGYTNWKFVVPFLVILLIEVFANYIFLEPAALQEKILVAVSAVIVVFVCGGCINICLKSKTGLRTQDEWKQLKKWLLYGGVLLSIVFFALTLIFFVFYRAGLPFTTIDIFSKLGEAFTNNITDLGLALLNILFLLFVVKSFRNATSRVSGYDALAKKRNNSTREYKLIRGRLHKQARAVFDGAHATIRERRNTSSEIDMSWRTIKETCESIPTSEHDATRIITHQYETTIKKYREGFDRGRFPNADGRVDMRTKIPQPLRVGAPIETLMSEDDSMRRRAAFQELSSLNFEEEIEQFRDRMEKWTSENEDFNKLNEFGRELIHKHRIVILQEMRDDGINQNEENELSINE